MKVAVFSTKPYDRQFLGPANAGRHELRYLDCRLTVATTALAKGSSAVCLFASDSANAATIMAFAHMGVRLIALRSAGFNNVDLSAAHAHGIAVARVPAYSPHAVAEHTFALILSLVRKVHRAYVRVREGNFSLDGLMGFDLFGKTVGVIGAGNIGSVVAKIATGFGCEVLAYDPVRRPECECIGVQYIGLPELFERSDVVTLHCPLNESTRHLIDGSALARMKPGALLINTSRGAVVDTKAVIHALKRRQLGGLAIDVYEEEDALFFEDRSDQAIIDDQFARLLTFPNVLVTGHQGFFTVEGLTNIAATTIANLDAFEQTGRALHPVGIEQSAPQPATSEDAPVIS
nr:2-hydroxyacid dehydrogenase [Sphingomonas sp.]